MSSSEINTKLPSNWSWVKLGDIITVNSGKGLTSSKMFTNGKYPVYGGNGITGYYDSYLFDDEKLIIGRVGAKCGVVHLTKRKCWVTDNALIVNYNSKFVYQLFLYYCLIDQNLNKLAISTAQPVISGRKIYQQKIPLPPLDEQHRIVEKIEELFSDLDNGIENLKTAKEQIKTYRQAVLKSAFEGKLVQDKSKKTKVKSGNGELPEGWEWVRVDEISENMQIGIVRSNKDQFNDRNKIPYIKMNNVTTDGKVLLDDIVYVDASIEEIGKFSVNKGDLLFNTRNSFELVGKTGIIRDERVTRIYNNNLLRIRVKSGYNPFFINYQINSPEFKSKLKSEKRATTNICAIYQKDLFPMKFKIPSLSEQTQIVEEIEKRFSVADKMEAAIDDGLKKSEALRQSILKQAFEGKLVS